MNIVVYVMHRANNWFGGWFKGFVGEATTTDKPGASAAIQSLELVGGPLDGLIWNVEAADVWQLPPLVEIPVGRSYYGLIAGQPEDAERPLSIAAYRLDFNGPKWLYRFEYHYRVPAAEAETETDS